VRTIAESATFRERPTKKKKKDRFAARAEAKQNLMEQSGIKQKTSNVRSRIKTYNIQPTTNNKFFIINYIFLQ